MADPKGTPVGKTHPTEAGKLQVRTQNGITERRSARAMTRLKATITNRGNNTRRTPLTVKITQATGRPKAFKKGGKIELGTGADLSNDVKGTRLLIAEMEVVARKPDKVFADTQHIHKDTRNLANLCRAKTKQYMTANQGGGGKRKAEQERLQP